MPAGSSGENHFQLHQVHYYDKLIQDFKGEYKLKSNSMAEIFGLYHLADDKSVIEQEKDVWNDDDVRSRD